MAGFTLPGGLGRALRHRNLRLYLIANLQSNVCTWAARLATGWLTWHLTQSTSWLGIMVFAELAPMVLFAPLGGATVDRHGAVRCSRISQLSLTAIALGPTILTFTDLITPYWMMVFAVMQGMVAAMNNPAHLAMLGDVVPPEDMRPAVTLQAGIVQTSRFLGPVVAGLIIPWGGPAWVFLLSAFGFAVYWLLLLPIKANTIERGERRGLGSEFMDGVRYARSNAIIASVLVFSAILAVLIRPVIDLFPAFSDRVFARGAGGLSMLLAAMGIGSILGVIVMALRERASGLEKIFTVSSATSALLLAVFAFTSNFWIAVGVVGLFGFSNNISGICGQTLVQAEVAPAMRARILSMLGLTFRAVPAIGALVMGFAAERFGLAAPIVTAAILCLIAWPPLSAKLRRAGAAAELPA
jgi:MFS family permease